jgi:hypothetical protein
MKDDDLRKGKTPSARFTRFHVRTVACVCDRSQPAFARNQGVHDVDAAAKTANARTLKHVQAMK